jgi:hypothetical protein
MNCDGRIYNVFCGVFDATCERFMSFVHLRGLCVFVVRLDHKDTKSTKKHKGYSLSSSSIAMAAAGLRSFAPLMK